MRQVIKEIYKFEELSDKAKNNAREWYRQVVGNDYADFHAPDIYDTAQTAALLLGVEIAERKGSERLAIFWQGFSYQGDGACFEGSYRFAKGSVAAVKKEFPTNTALHNIAEHLQDLQKANGYKLEGEITVDSRYSHSHAMSLSDNIDDIETHKALQDTLRSFADWIYDLLREDYFYQTSDECLDESIINNDYEFDANGDLHS